MINKEEIKSMLLEFGCSFKTNSRSFILSCPRCRKSGKLYIRQSDGRFVCFRCKETENYQGRPEYVLADLTTLSIPEIKKRLYGEESKEYIDNIIVFNPIDFLDEDESLYSEYVLAKIVFTPDIFDIDNVNCAQGLAYLESRGITLSVARKYNIKYSPAQRRVVFPVQYKNELLGWQARTISDQKEYWDDEFNCFVPIHKVLTSKGLKKDKTVMFRDNLVGSKHCVLCEGPVDAIKANLCGGNVATMGKAVSYDQLNLIKSHGIQKLYLALDPDAAAEVRRILEFFKEIEVFDMRAKNAKDLGEMSEIEVKELFDKAPLLKTNQAIVYIKNHYGMS